MNPSIKEFHDYVVQDVLGHLPNLRSKAMFGGYGIYLDGSIFAIITDDSMLRFKVDNSNRQQYIDLGSTPFVYTGHKDRKPTTMNYYVVPEEIMEDREKVTDWAYQSSELNKKK